jgi:hypothetical protein
MATRGKVAVGVAAVMTAAVLIWMFQTKVSQPRVRKINFYRTHEVVTDRVAQLELKLNGVPFGSQVHEVRVGAQVQFSGHLVLNPDRVPQGLFRELLLVSRHPVGSDEKVWSQRSANDWIIITLPKPFETTFEVTGERMTPGEYEMRLYLDLKDLEGDESRVDYLGQTARLKILPPK